MGFDNLEIYCSCFAKSDELDEGGVRRTKLQRQTLISGIEPGTLWDEYGIVADVIVRLFL